VNWNENHIFSLSTKLNQVIAENSKSLNSLTSLQEENKKHLAEIDDWKLKIRKLAEMTKFDPSIKLNFSHLENCIFIQSLFDLSLLEALYNTLLDSLGLNDQNVQSWKAILENLKVQRDYAKQNGEELKKSKKGWKR
jgi:hypothetical protein